MRNRIRSLHTAFNAATTLKFTRSHSAISLAVGCALLSTAALAQAETAQGARSANEESTDSSATSLPTIGEVVVTATRRAEKIDDIPISITALSAESLEKEGSRSFTDLKSSIVGLSFADRGPGQSQLAIRGISSTNGFDGANTAFKETVGVYLDETSISWNSFNPEPRLFDTNRVEVLRGPQGTLFGAGSMSGALRYVSNLPNMQGFAGRVSVDGSHNDRGGEGGELNALLNVPLAGNTAALRVSGFHADVPGYIDNVASLVDPRAKNHGQPATKNINDEESTGGRAQFLWDPEGPFKLLARYFHQHTDLGGSFTEDTYEPGAGAPGNNPADADLQRYQQSRLTPEPQNMNFSVGSLELSYDLGFAELLSISSHLGAKRRTAMEVTDFFSPFGAGPPLPAPDGVAFVYRQRYNVLSQELRLVSPASRPFTWLLGGYYQRIRQKTEQHNEIPGTLAALGAPPGSTLCTFFGVAAEFCDPNRPEDVLGSRENRYESQISAFGEMGWQFAERLKLIAGLRVFDYKLNVFTPVPTTGPIARGLFYDTPFSEDGQTTKLALEYRPADRILTYVSRTEGFRLGGAKNPVPATCVPFLPPGTSTNNVVASDNVTAYEVGAKVSASNRLRVNIAAFHQKWDDIPVQLRLGCGFSVVSNGGLAEVNGVETEINVKPLDNLDLSASFAHTDAQFTKTFASIGIYDGGELPLVPKYTVGFSANYTVPLGDAWQAFMYSSYRWRDHVYNNQDVTIRTRLGSYGTVNARAGLTNGKVSTSLYANNLTNTYAVTFKDTLIFNDNRDSVIRPRTIGFSVDYQF